MKCSRLPLLLVILAVSACGDLEAPLLEPAVPNLSGEPTRETINFSATALCGPHTGEHIAFGGTIEHQVHQTTDARGKVHQHRVFGARGMTGTGVVSGIEYDVIGGAEMFSWQFDEAGNLRILIHQGTLVFQADDHQIIARHVIRQVPGPQPALNTWICKRVSS